MRLLEDHSRVLFLNEHGLFPYFPDPHSFFDTRKLNLYLCHVFSRKQPTFYSFLLILQPSYSGKLDKLSIKHTFYTPL